MTAHKVSAYGYSAIGRSVAATRKVNTLKRGTVDVMAEPGAAVDGGRDAGFPGLFLSARPPLLSLALGAKTRFMKNDPHL